MAFVPTFKALFQERAALYQGAALACYLLSRMLLLLCSWVGRLAGLSLCLTLLPALGQAQCPKAAACTPGAASSPLAAAYGMGITNVTLGTINNTSGGYEAGYQDFSCAPAGAGSTRLTVSIPTPLSIRNGAVAKENVRVWIDYNNDGNFTPNELAFSSDNQQLHTGSLTPPATAVLGVALRLRVASDFADAAVPTACATPQYSQAEDYAVTLVAAAGPPAAAFAASAATTCSGTVQFTDQSTGAPTGWRWDFGDNTGSTQQSPAHTYAAPGTYAVTLTATNANGGSTSAATAITYDARVPVPACAGLAATGSCCNYGLVRVRLGTIDNTSADGSAGYQDFTCPQRTSLLVDRPYPLVLTTGGPNLHDTRAWLDLNNDGAFTAEELVGEALSAASPTLTLTVPATAVLGQPLRLRLVADGAGTNPRPCAAPSLGQVEDYTVLAGPNTAPPMVAFASDYVAGRCAAANTYTFTDQSTNGATAWRWAVSPAAGVSFVGGTSASSRNPKIAFAAAGYYTVTLTATNANGSASASSPTPLLVQVPCLSYCAASGGYSDNASSSLWITKVQVSAAGGGADFSNASGNGAGGYTFFTSQNVVLTPGATQTITVTANQRFYRRTLVWIDYNQDGVFANTTGPGGELVLNDLQSGAVNSATVVVPAGLGSTRMRVVVNGNGNVPNACATFQGEGEVEDYLVNAAQPLAAREARALAALTVSPNPSPDGRLQIGVSEPGLAGPYDLEVLSLLGARLRAQPLRLSPAAPAALDLSALPPGLYLLRLTNAQGQSALRRVALRE